jgi:N-acetylglucosaminyl-diphospho-decaprenol L-rhamnosyltransferase
VNPSVSIVIINYNGAAFVRSSIESALAQRYDGALEVVVLDNRSTDDSLEVLRAVPSIRLIENGTNAGYGGGVNRAVAACTSDYVALLNPDAVADPRWVAQVVPWMNERRVDVASSVVRAGEGVWFAGGTFIVPLGLAFNRRRVARVADWVSGCAMIVRRSTFVALGGFDEAFFLYCEDADLCLRAKAAGHRPAVFPAPLVDHPSDGKSTNQLGFAKATIMYASRGRLIAKHVPALWQPSALAFTALLSPLLYGVGFPRLFSVARAVLQGFNAGSSRRSSRTVPGRG